jgi:hypothetical protein
MLPRFRALLVLVFAISCASSAWAEQGPAEPAPGVGVRADQIVPADCVLYFELGDTTRSIERLKNSPLGKIYTEDEVQQFLAEPLVKLREEIARRQQRAQLDFVSMASAFKGQVAVTLLDVKRGQNEPIVELVVIGEAKEAWRNEIEAVVSELLGRLREMAPELAVQEYQYGAARVKVLAIGEAEIAWTFVGDLAIAGIGRANIEKIVDNLGENKGEVLAECPAYIEVKKAAGEAPDLLVYGSGTQFVEKFRDVMNANDLAEFEKLGLGKTDGAAYALTLGEAGFREVLSVYSPEKTGVLKLLDQQPLELTGLKYVPDRALAYMALRVDPKKTLDAFLDIVGEFEGAEEAQEARDEIREMEANLQINLQEQVYDALTGEIQAYLAFPPLGGAIWPDVVVMIELEDAKPFGELLKIVQAVAAADLAERAPDGVQKFYDFPYGDRTVRYIKTGDRGSPIAPAWCLTEDYLIVTSGPPAMKRALRALDGGMGLDSSEAFVTTTRKMSRDRSLLLFVDTAAAFNFGYNSAVALVQNRPKHEITGLDPNLMPLAETISQHLAGWAISFGVKPSSIFVESSGPLPILPTLIVVGAGGDQVQRAERRRRRQPQRLPQEPAPPAIPDGEGGDIF